jgi:restriction system protein
VLHIGNDDRIALRALDEGFVCIGWTAMGDLSLHDTREKTRAAMEAAYPTWTTKKISSSYGQTYRFAHEMQVGEPIVFPVRPTKEIAIGRIAGEYRWADDQDLVANDHNNVRPVE